MDKNGKVKLTGAAVAAGLAFAAGQALAPAEPPANRGIAFKACLADVTARLEKSTAGLNNDEAGIKAAQPYVRIAEEGVRACARANDIPLASFSFKIAP